MKKPYLSWYIFLAVILLIAAFVPILMSGNDGAGPIPLAIAFALVAPPAVIWLLQRMGYPIGRAISCPKCGTEMPLFRKPASVGQAAWGGYTCPKCGTEMDRSGKAIEAR